jgi:DNA replication protein DnaC
MKTETCETHGDYELHEIKVFDSVIAMKGCPECNKIEREAEELKEKKESDLRQQEARRARRLKAGISERNLFKTFLDFKADSQDQHNCLHVVSEYAEGIKNGAKNSLIMIGTVGTGKTLLASAIVEHCIVNKSCRLIRAIDMIRRFKETWHKGSDVSETEVIEYYASIDLLLLDEIGVQFGSDTEKLFLFDVIDQRYQRMLPTVLISNLNSEGIKEAVGNRVIDRVREGGGRRVIMQWESKRL